MAANPGGTAMKKAWVYWNLHKQVWSVRIGGRVQYHSRCLELTDVEFRVWAGGRDRVRREGAKNVHAFAVGTVELAGEVLGPVNLEGGYGVTYDPYKYDQFVRRDDKSPVYRAPRVVMYAERVGDKVIPRVVAFPSDRSASAVETPTTQPEATNADQPERGGYEVQRCGAVPGSESLEREADRGGCDQLTAV